MDHLIILVKVLSGCLLWVAFQSIAQDQFKRYISYREDKRYCGGIVNMLVRGADETHILILFGHSYMSRTYEKYIDGLPDHKKNEIVDHMLSNAQKRIGSTELLDVIGAMHAVERQTVVCICSPRPLVGELIYNPSYSPADIAEKILAFRFTHPINPA